MKLDKNVKKFIKETEGKHEKVDDARKTSITRTKMTNKEVENQNKASTDVFDKFLKSK